MRLHAITAAAALALGAIPPADAQEPAGGADEASLAQGSANRARVKVPPAFLDGPKAELGEAEKAQGHHGTVVVEGVIAADGRMHSARVKSGSGSSGVDAIALAAARASRFTPATDADGAPLPVLTAMPFDLVGYKSAGGGAFEYRCGQFVRDMDWWRSANPGRPWGEHELYKLTVGLSMLSLIQSAGGDQAKLKKAIGRFEGKWEAAIARCRAKPAMLQKDALFR